MKKKELNRPKDGVGIYSPYHLNTNIHTNLIQQLELSVHSAIIKKYILNFTNKFFFYLYILYYLEKTRKRKYLEKT